MPTVGRIGYPRADSAHDTPEGLKTDGLDVYAPDSESFSQLGRNPEADEVPVPEIGEFSSSQADSAHSLAPLHQVRRGLGEIEFMESRQATQMRPSALALSMIQARK